MTTPIRQASKPWLDLVVKKAPPARKPPPWAARTILPVDGQAPLVERAILYLDKVEAATQGNGGHNALLFASRAMVVGFAFDDATALDILWTHYNPRCQPPWDPDDVGERRDFERKVVQARETPGQKPYGWLLDELGLRSGVEALASLARGRESQQNLLRLADRLVVAQGDDLELPPEEDMDSRRPFPVDVFPGPIARYVNAMATSHNVDLSYAGLPVLAVAGAAMGNAWRIALKDGYGAPPTLWVGIVGESGMNKSGPMDQVVEPLLWPLPSSLVEPSLVNPQGQSVVQDATVGAAVAVLQNSPRGLLCFRDELRGWVGGFGQFNGASGAEEAAWLSFWNSKPYQVDRKTNDEHTFIPAAAVSVLGSIQPGILAKVFSPERFASGLVARFLITCPPRRRMPWTEATVGKELTECWTKTVDWLRSRPFADYETERKRYRPHVLTLTPEAKAAHVDFVNLIDHESWTLKDEKAKALCSKAIETSGRLALIHHGLSRASEGEQLNGEIEVASVLAGQAWTRWCLEEQIRVYGFGVGKEREKSAAYLVKRIHERFPAGDVGASDVVRLNARWWPNTTVAKAAMSQIVGLGYARWTDETHKRVALLPGAEQ